MALSRAARPDLPCPLTASPNTEGESRLPGKLGMFALVDGVYATRPARFESASAIHVFKSDAKSAEC